MDQFLLPFLSQLAGRAPVLLVCLAGFVLALACWKRSPTAGLLAALGTSLYACSSILGTLVSAWLIRRQMEAHDEDTREFVISGAFFSLAHALALGLLVAAVFVGRPRPGPPAV
jgi:hypothetical protein